MRLTRVAALQPNTSHSLAQTAFLNKFLLKPDELLIDQIIRLMDQANCDVRHNFRRSSFNELAVELVTLRRSSSQTSNKLRFL